MFYDNNKMFRLNDGTLMHTLWDVYASRYWDDGHRWVDTTSFVKEVMDKWYIVQWFVRVENWEYTIFDEETYRPNEWADWFIDMDRSTWTVAAQVFGSSAYPLTLEWSFYDLYTKQASDYPFINPSSDPAEPNFLLTVNPFDGENPMWMTTVFFPEAKELIHVLTNGWYIMFSGDLTWDMWMESWHCNIYIHWYYNFSQGENYNEWTDGDYNTIYIEWYPDDSNWFGVVTINNQNYTFGCQQWMNPEPPMPDPEMPEEEPAE